MKPEILPPALQPPWARHKQVGALPFRHAPTGHVEVLLITSRRSCRWIIPKGWPIPGLSFQEAAAREAFEEAGLVGSVTESSIGSFEYMKRLGDGTRCRCSVEVYPLQVAEVRAWWDEASQRSRRWCTDPEVAELVAHEPLRQMIARFMQSEADPHRAQQSFIRS